MTLVTAAAAQPASSAAAQPEERPDDQRDGDADADRDRRPHEREPTDGTQRPYPNVSMRSGNAVSDGAVTVEGLPFFV